MPDQTGPPEYTLTCRSPERAAQLLDVLKARGAIYARTDGPNLIVTWGGLFPFIANVGDMARQIDAASDLNVAQFYADWADRRAQQPPEEAVPAPTPEPPAPQRPAPDPYTTRLWLPVKHSDGRSDTLYVRDIRTAHTLRPEGEIHLWPDAEVDPGPAWPAVRGYHGHDGLYNVELAAFVPNPDEEQRDRMRRHGPISGWAWWTTDGEPSHHDLLRAAGWTEYGADNA